MRIVEFVGIVVALIAFFAWLLGRPHTLASVRRDATGTGFSDGGSIDTASMGTSDTDDGMGSDCSDGGADGGCDGGGGD